MLVDGPDLGVRVRDAIGGGTLALGMDAIGGSAMQRIGRCVSDGGTVLNYGVLSGESPMMGARELVFGDARLRGFWLRRWFSETPPAEVAALYHALAARLADGTLERVYPFTRLKEALAHAARGGRSGKILVSCARDAGA